MTGIPTSAGLEAGEALKPCPFCGAEAKLWPPTYSEENPSEVIGPAFVNCPDCCVAIIGTWEDDAVAAWNRRSALIPPSRAAKAEKRLPVPDGVSMTGGLICLGYEDADERDLAYDALEAYGAGAASSLAAVPQAVAPTGETGELPLWRTGSWGDGSTPPYLANIFCDAHEATIAAGLPKGIVADIVEAHNDALTALSAKLAEAERERSDLLLALDRSPAGPVELRAQLSYDRHRAESAERKLEETRKSLAEARDHINRYADTAVEHDLIARIDALTSGGGEQ